MTSTCLNIHIHKMNLMLEDKSYIMVMMNILSSSAITFSAQICVTVQTILRKFTCKPKFMSAQIMCTTSTPTAHELKHMFAVHLQSVEY